MNQPGGLLDIVIVNWNSGGFLSDCLRSVAQHPRDQAMLQTVTVVDNASTDGSENVGDSGEVVSHWIQNETNFGFGKACNQGARIGNAPYILFLNPDTRLTEGSLSIPLAYLESTAHRNIAIAADLIQADHHSGRADQRVFAHVQRRCSRMAVDTSDCHPEGSYPLDHRHHPDLLLTALQYRTLLDMALDEASQFVVLVGNVIAPVAKGL